MNRLCLCREGWLCKDRGRAGGARGSNGADAVLMATPRGILITIREEARTTIGPRPGGILNQHFFIFLAHVDPVIIHIFLVSLFQINVFWVDLTLPLH